MPVSPVAAAGTPGPFAVRDCVLVAIATGKRAQSLRELRDGLQSVEAGSIYFHFWGRLLRPRLDDTEFHNDFAVWARHALHDKQLAERLAVLDPADFADLEQLRQELVDVVEERIEETETLIARRDQQFSFRLCQTVVFDTGVQIARPEDLAAAIPAMSLGSIYFHVIESRRREPVRIDDFRHWPAQHGDRYDALCQQLAAIDPYFSSLAELRDGLGRVVGDYFRAVPA